VFSLTHFLDLHRILERGLREHRSVITWGCGAELYDDVRSGYLDAAFAVHATTGVSQMNYQWEEEMCWVCSPHFVLGEGRPVPLLSWPNSIADLLAIEALAEMGVAYSVVLVATDLTTHLVAARAGIGVFIMPRRLVPADLRSAEFHFLPRLSSVASSIYVNEAIPPAEVRLLRDAICDVMPPNAPFGPEVSHPLPEAVSH
jgi:DNA-binding transcriptional LysR family regulator